MSSKKPTNPKDAIAGGKVPPHLCPRVAMYEWTLAQLDGARKYGAHNWRVAGVRYSVYINAIQRHLDKLLEGEDRDPDSPGRTVHHLGNIMACCAILLDAEANGKLTDDRPPKMPEGWMDVYHDATQIILKESEVAAPFTQSSLD